MHHHCDTLEMSPISQDVSRFQAKKLPGKQVHSGAEIFWCLFCVSFKAEGFTTGEMCQWQQSWQFWAFFIFAAIFLGSASSYFSVCFNKEKKSTEQRRACSPVAWPHVLHGYLWWAEMHKRHLKIIQPMFAEYLVILQSKMHPSWKPVLTLMYLSSYVSRTFSK